jgi:hypothetical protein
MAYLSRKSAECIETCQNLPEIFSEERLLTSEFRVVRKCGVIGLARVWGVGLYQGNGTLAKVDIRKYPLSVQPQSW